MVDAIKKFQNITTADEIVGVVVYSKRDVETFYSFSLVKCEMGTIKVDFIECPKGTIIIINKNSIKETPKGLKARGADTLWHRLYSLYLYPIKFETENRIRWMEDNLSIEDIRNVLYIYNAHVEMYNNKANELESEYNVKFDRLEKRNLVETEEIEFFYNTSNILDVCIVKEYSFDIDINKEGGYLYGKRCYIPEKVSEIEFEILGEKYKSSYAPSMGVYDYDDDVCYYKVTEIKFIFDSIEYTGEIPVERVDKNQVYITKKQKI